jgi:hypothetical protein
MNVSTFNRKPRWRREHSDLCSGPHTETIAARAYALEVVQPLGIDQTEAERQLAHARQQQALAQRYPRPTQGGSD